MTKVSVIIPIYNTEEYLRQCLDSIVNQTLADIEIICVDDGSVDGSLGILREYKGNDSRIKVICRENGGAGAARNTGLRQATGEYLLFLDADDFFERNMLEAVVKEAEQYRADFVVFGSDQYHMDKKEFVPVNWVVRKKDIPPYQPFTYRQLTDNVFKTFVGWAWDKLYRRSFVEEHNLWFQEQRTTNDMLFVFSALVLAKRIVFVNKVLAHQRRGGKATLSVTREKSWQCFYRALTTLRERLKGEDVYWELEQDYVNYALHACLWNLNTLKEPTHQMLKEKLCGEWFEILGISDKNSNYFYNKKEYEEYKNLIK